MLRRSFPRAANGFSLITVTVIGLIASLWLAAMLAGMVPAYRSAATNKFGEQLRSAAESYANYIVAYYNANLSSFPTAYNTTTVFSSALLPSPSSMSLPIGVSVTANVINIAPLSNPTPNQQSYVYDAFAASASAASNTLPAGSTNFNWSSTSANQSYWSIIDVTVSYAGISKEVRLFVKPNYFYSDPSQPDQNQQFNQTPTGGSSNYFSTGMLGTSYVLLGNNTSTAGYDSSTGNALTTGTSLNGTGNFNLGGDVTSYNRAILSNNVSVGGSLNVLANNNPASVLPPAGGTGFTDNGQSIQAGTGDTVDRVLETAGSFPGTLPTGSVDGAYTPGTNSPFPQTPSQFLNTVPQTSQPADQTAQTQLVPAPTPAGSSTSNTGVAVPAGSSNNLQVGDYALSSLSVGDGGSLVPSGTNPLNAGDPVTRIFLDGGSGNSVVSINGNVNASGAPANFEIWYNGSGTLEIGNTATGGNGTGPININATIYAPNATVLLSGSSGNTVNFNGAIVANTIAGSMLPNGALVPTSNLNFKFDNDLTVNGGLFPSGLSTPQQKSLTYNPTAIQPNGSGGTPQLQVTYYWESQ